jgi:hypothetical protein
MIVTMTNKAIRIAKTLNPASIAMPPSRKPRPIYGTSQIYPFNPRLAIAEAGPSPDSGP